MTQKQIIETPLTGGLSQRTAGPHVPLGEFTAIQNLRQNKNGSLSKRPGNTRLPSLFQLPNSAGTSNLDVSLGGALSAYGNQLLISCNAGNAVYQPSLGTFGTMKSGSEAGLTRTSLGLPSTIIAAATTAYRVAPSVTTDGVRYFYLYVDSLGNSYCSIEDIASGALIVDRLPIIVTNSVGWFVPLLIGTTFYAVYLDGTVLKQQSLVAPYAGFGVSFAAPVTLQTGVVTSQPFDAVVNGANITIAYCTSGPSSVVLATYTPAGGVVGGTTVAASLTNDVRLSFGFGSIWVAWTPNGTGGVFAKSYSAALAPQMSGAGIVVNGTNSIYSLAVVAQSANRAVVTASDSRGTCATLIDSTLAAGAGAIVLDGPTTNLISSSVLLSKPFVQGNDVYYWVQVWSADGVTSSVIATEYGLLNPVVWTSVLVSMRLATAVSGTLRYARPVAVDSPRFAFPIANLNITGAGSSYAPLSVVSPSANRWAIFTGIRQTAYVSTWARVLADFAATFRWKSVQLGTLLLRSSGMATNYDGDFEFENGFLQHAVLTSAALTPQTAGTLTHSGTYQYRVVPIFPDAAGNLHRGIPSPLAQVVLGSTQGGVVLSIPSLHATDRIYPDGSVRLARPLYWEIYRSQANAASAGNDVATNFVDIVPNAATANFTTYTDTIGDVFIANNAECYTFGGDLPNGCPPGGLDIEACGGRAWLLSDDGNNCYFSKAIVDGEAVNFTDGFTQPLDVNDGVALKALDEKIIALTKTRLYFQAGVGPEDNGQQSDFQGFQRIQSSVGCNDRRSVVSTPDGVMFLSSIGFYLLDRALEVIYIGQPVTDEVLKFPICVASVLHASQPWVYFYMTNAAGTAGERLIYDYRLQKWYTDTLPGVPVSAVNLENGTHYWLDTTGQVWQEDATGTIGTDDGIYVKSLWTAGSMGGASIFAWMRAYRMQLLYQRNSRCDIILTTTNDYSTSLGLQQQVFWDREFESFPDAVQMIEIKHKRTNTTAVEITVQDQAPANTSGGSSPSTAPDNGLGVTYFGVGFEIESKPGFFQLPGAQAKG